MMGKSVLLFVLLVCALSGADENESATTWNEANEWNTTMKPILCCEGRDDKYDTCTGGICATYVVIIGDNEPWVQRKCLPTIDIDLGCHKDTSQPWLTQHTCYCDQEYCNAGDHGGVEVVTNTRAAHPCDVQRPRSKKQGVLIDVNTNERSNGAPQGRNVAESTFFLLTLVAYLAWRTCK